jgi:hypothetical protein
MLLKGFVMAYQMGSKLEIPGTTILVKPTFTWHLPKIHSHTLTLVKEKT